MSIKNEIPYRTHIDHVKAEDGEANPCVTFFPLYRHIDRTTYLPALTCGNRPVDNLPISAIVSAGWLSRRWSRASDQHEWTCRYRLRPSPWAPNPAREGHPRAIKVPPLRRMRPVASIRSVPTSRGHEPTPVPRHPRSTARPPGRGSAEPHLRDPASGASFSEPSVLHQRLLTLKSSH